ncbi:MULTISPECIES: hypothetical protein [Paenibacillus]|uniref:hypothetical protein n=1 Tax=Paenibacillus TaxID=44249 RepID=UPI0022B8A41E|nr:hypothetical protein [Paenibacillus caseinilyticus]MCZ8521611.1 hypothetical protein [Paenibacillus caseinilyticus]
MKKRMLSVLFLCFALFAIIPITSASAVSNLQITGGGNLVITSQFSGKTADVDVINQSGQVVFTRAYGSFGGTGTIDASIPNLPYGTYRILIGGPALGLYNLHYSFQ